MAAESSPFAGNVIRQEVIRFTFDGEARSTFLRNRLGFCVCGRRAFFPATSSKWRISATGDLLELTPYEIVRFEWR